MTKLKPKKLKKTNLIQKNTQPYTLNSKDVYGMISGPTWSQIYVNVLRGKLNSVHFVGGISRQIILHNTLTSNAVWSHSGIAGHVTVLRL